MHFVYCIYSPEFHKTYVGRTSNVEGRLEAHNHPSNKGFTKRFQPWVLLFFEEFETIQEASRKEKFYKTGVGRELINHRLKEQVSSLGSYPPRRT
jgi:putative endonuclease